MRTQKGLLSPEAYRTRFGGFIEACELAGLDRPIRKQALLKTRRVAAQRSQLLQEIVSLFPQDVQIHKPADGSLRQLMLRGTMKVCVVLCRHFQPSVDPASRWIVRTSPGRLDGLCLVCRLTPDGEGFHDFHLLPRTPEQHYFRIRQESSWLATGVKLHHLQEFLQAATSLGAS